MGNSIILTISHNPYQLAGGFPWNVQIIESPLCFTCCPQAVGHTNLSVSYIIKVIAVWEKICFTLNKDPKKVSPKMDYPKFRAAEVITSFLLEDCAQVALQYFWFEESFESHEFALTDCDWQLHSELGKLWSGPVSRPDHTSRFLLHNFLWFHQRANS